MVEKNRKIRKRLLKHKLHSNKLINYFRKKFGKGEMREIEPPVFYSGFKAPNMKIDPSIANYPLSYFTPPQNKSTSSQNVNNTKQPNKAQFSSEPANSSTDNSRHYTEEQVMGFGSYDFFSAPQNTAEYPNNYTEEQVMGFGSYDFFDKLFVLDNKDDASKVTPIPVRHNDSKPVEEEHKESSAKTFIKGTIAITCASLLALGLGKGCNRTPGQVIVTQPTTIDDTTKQIIADSTTDYVETTNKVPTNPSTDTTQTPETSTNNVTQKYEEPTNSTEVNSSENVVEDFTIIAEEKSTQPNIPSENIIGDVTIAQENTNWQEPNTRPNIVVPPEESTTISYEESTTFPHENFEEETSNPNINGGDFDVTLIDPEKNEWVVTNPNFDSHTEQTSKPETQTEESKTNESWTYEERLTNPAIPSDFDENKTTERETEVEIKTEPGTESDVEIQTEPKTSHSIMDEITTYISSKENHSNSNEESITSPSLNYEEQTSINNNTENTSNTTENHDESSRITEKETQKSSNENENVVDEISMEF